jgi:hypothetical protein
VRWAVVTGDVALFTISQSGYTECYIVVLPSTPSWPCGCDTPPNGSLDEVEKLLLLCERFTSGEKKKTGLQASSVTRYLSRVVTVVVTTVTLFTTVPNSSRSYSVR